ncbi:20055_t:CDS:2, partial [Funneliformis geosporum]
SDFEANKDQENKLKEEIKELKSAKAELELADQQLVEKDKELAANKTAKNTQDELEAEKAKFEHSQRKLKEEKGKVTELEQKLKDSEAELEKADKEDDEEKKELKRQLANEREKVKGLNYELEGLREELRVFKKSQKEKSLKEEAEKEAKLKSDSYYSNLDKQIEEKRKLKDEKKELQNELSAAQKTINLLNEKNQELTKLREALEINLKNNTEQEKSDSLIRLAQKNKRLEQLLRKLTKRLKEIDINEINEEKGEYQRKYQDATNELSLREEELEEVNNLNVKLKDQVKLLRNKLKNLREKSKSTPQPEIAQNPLVLLAHQNQLDFTFSNPDLPDYPILTAQELENEISPTNEFILLENDSASSQLDRYTRTLRKLDHQVKILSEKLTTSELKKNELNAKYKVAKTKNTELEKKNQSFQTQLQTRHQQIAKQIQQKREFRSELKVANQTITNLEKRVDELTSQRDNRPNITLIEHDNLVKQIGDLTTQTSSLRTEKDN